MIAATIGIVLLSLLLFIVFFGPVFLLDLIWILLEEWHEEWKADRDSNE
jgi:hypothetical protein